MNQTQFDVCLETLADKIISLEAVIKQQRELSLYCTENNDRLRMELTETQALLHSSTGAKEQMVVDLSRIIEQQKTEIAKAHARISELEEPKMAACWEDFNAELPEVAPEPTLEPTA